MPDLFNKKLKPYLTLEEAISDLPFIKSSEESFEAPFRAIQMIIKVYA